MKKKRIIWASALVVMAVVVIFILVYFEPQALLINKTAKEEQKGKVITRVAPTTTFQTSETSTTPTTTLPAKSTWVSREHTTTGEVFLTQDNDGKTYVRFENLSTDNGPDLRVYLAKSLSSNGTPSDFVDLGELVANKGDAYYRIPSDVNVSEYAHVVIWCKRFSVSFADAKI